MTSTIRLVLGYSDRHYVLITCRGNKNKLTKMAMMMKSKMMKAKKAAAKPAPKKMKKMMKKK